MFEGVLWTAPEILRLRNANYVGTQKADIYAFGIICSEVITKKPVWNIADCDETEDGINYKKRNTYRTNLEIIYRVRKGGFPLFRPKLIYDSTLDINLGMVLIFVEYIF